MSDSWTELRRGRSGSDLRHARLDTGVRHDGADARLFPQHRSICLGLSAECTEADSGHKPGHKGPETGQKARSKWDKKQELPGGRSKVVEAWIGKAGHRGGQQELDLRTVSQRDLQSASDSCSLSSNAEHCLCCPLHPSNSNNLLFVDYLYLLRMHNFYVGRFDPGPFTFSCHSKSVCDYSDRTVLQGKCLSLIHI